MSTRSDYDEALDNFTNGNIRKWVKQFDNISPKADFIDYLCIDLNRPEIAIEMVKSYFIVKER